MTLQDYLARYLPALNRELRRTVDRFSPGPPEYDLMLRYHLGWVDEHGNPVEASVGKQIRPSITLLCAEGVGGDWEKALPAAVAVELIHNFSLVHDDIEDDSPLRRGRPTVWKVWGRANAINAGDALFALAHMALWTLSECGIPASQVLAIWRLFEETNLVLTRGQYLDMAFERRVRVSVDEYLEMIAAKSAALISLAAQVGALVAGAPPERVERCAAFGRYLGLAFQVRDDVLGIWGDPEVTGKSAATDVMSRKKSLPVLYGLGRSGELAAIYGSASLGESGVAHVVEILESVGAREFAVRKEEYYLGEAFDALESGIVVSGLLEALSELLRSLLGRGG